MQLAGDGVPLDYMSSVTLVLQEEVDTGQGETSATGDDITLARTIFGYTSLANRVEQGDGGFSLLRPRITSITTDSGATISIGYRTECSSDDLPETTDAAQETNDRLCYPVKWYPER